MGHHTIRCVKDCAILTGKRARKAGEHRVELRFTGCWAPWLAWLLDGWSGQQLADCYDATSLGDRFCGLVISVVYQVVQSRVWKV